MPVLMHSVFRGFGGVSLNTQIDAIGEVDLGLPCRILRPSAHLDELPDGRLSPTALVVHNSLVDLIGNLSAEGRLEKVFEFVRKLVWVEEK